MKSSRSAVHRDGCHVDHAATGTRPCVYGDRTSSRTVVLFGDSHAAQSASSDAGDPERPAPESAPWSSATPPFTATTATSPGRTPKRSPRSWRRRSTASWVRPGPAG
ncbi:hypothetical protein [Streptomyces sp. NPDC048438]|uniref:hypothetical protein n=1 Tax=Streptomyces sp. NPDC048438 TaxID=3365551 RepID=UPI003715CB05